MKIIHHFDEDGCCAGFWANRLPNDKESRKFYSINYGMPFPFDEIEKNDLVIIVDYSILPSEMDKLLEITPNVIWIDHHKSAIEKYKDYDKYICGIRDTRYSGCVLTCCYVLFLIAESLQLKDFSKWEDMLPLVPQFTKYIGDFDTWTFDFGKEKMLTFASGLETFDINPESKVWEDLLHKEEDTINKILDNGKIIMDYRRKTNKSLCDHKAFECDFYGYKAIAVNGVGVGTETFESIIAEHGEDYELAVGFNFDGETWSYALRSGFSNRSENVDVAKIASEIDVTGGGHFHASGCRSKELLCIK